MSNLDAALARYRLYARAEKLVARRWKKLVGNPEIDSIWHGDYLSEHPLIYAWDSAVRLSKRLYREYQLAMNPNWREGGEATTNE